MSQDWPARARALAPAIAAALTAIDAARALPEPLVDALRKGGFFRLLQPASLGGAELTPMVFAETIAALAEADASVAWCVCQGNGCAMAAAFLSEAAAAEIFGPEDGILAWGPVGPGRALPVEGGFVLDGTWHFASGSRHASWLGAHVPLVDAAGTALRDDAGAPRTRTMLFAKSAVRISDRWQVIGLKGTGSDSYTAEALFIPAHHALSRETPAERRETGPLFRFTANQVYAAGFAGVALGIGQAMVAALIALAETGKTSRGAGRSVRENQVVQSQLARSVARLGAARAYLRSVLGDAWALACADAREGTASFTPSGREAAMIRLAATFAIHEARDVVHTLYHAAGSTAIFEDQPFERRLRDINAVSQQSQGRQIHFESVGQILLGLPAENLF
ncbi:MAG: hypothetical protein KGL12_11975 [Rhodospirillales bacterium]|nr:hypothetical protein [Rhodospirillales bacterium]